MAQLYETAGIPMYSKLLKVNDDATPKTMQLSESGHIWGNWS